MLTMTELDDILEDINIDISIPTEDSVKPFPIRLVPFDEFCKCERFPRYPDRSEITVGLESIDREQSLVVFVSHCWWKDLSSCEEDNAEISLIDTASSDQFKLIVEGMALMLSNFTINLSNCYLWIDYSCLNQDENPVQELIGTRLERIIEACDCMFTPLFDDESECWSYPDVWANKYEEYMSTSWRGTDYSYMNRAWCRLEMFYNSVVALSPESTCDLKRSKISSSLLHRNLENKRAHFIYGSKEYNENMIPLILSPLPLTFLESYHPIRGKLFIGSDMEAITKMASLFKEVISKDPSVLTLDYNDSLSRADVYEGEYLNNMMHGKGIFRYANGNIYEGEFRDDKRHGFGIFRFANGDIYEGDFYNGNFRGHGKFSFANGNIYEGEYTDGKWDGKGTFKFVSGNVYEGEFQNDERHGKGVFTYACGDMYQGDYCNDKRQGKGLFKFANGNVYEGEFDDDRINGEGLLKYHNGDIYEGEFKDNKKHGKGIFTSRKGKVQRGVWESGVYKGKGRGSSCTTM